MTHKLFLGKFHHQRKYKEDLDYLVNLRKQMKEDEQKYYSNYDEEHNRKVQLLNDVK